jgi:hypothetical protein
MFPSCWDGVSLDAPDHKSHVVYPDPVMGGVCPEKHKIRIPTLYYETIWATAAFRNTAFRNISGTFVLSNGDSTGKFRPATVSQSNSGKGHSYHGDFQNGWDIGVLQRAIKSCTNSTGIIEECTTFSLQSPSEASKCKISAPERVANEDCIGPRAGLCGNISLFR